MRPLLFALALTAAPAFAQPALFPPHAEGTPDILTANPHVRIAPSVGVMFGLGTIAAAEAEWIGASPLSGGARVWTSGSEGFVEDAVHTVGWGAEALARVSTRTRGLDLRAGAGLGIADVAERGGFFVCHFGEPCDAPALFDGVLVYVPLAAGLDLYPFPGVGVGGQVRYGFSTTGVDLSSVEVGLRVRVAR